MTILRLLVVEDYEGDIEIWRSAIERYRDQKQREVVLVECKDLGEALSKLDSTFDGAIIDLKLGDEGGEGNQVIKMIEEQEFRIPVAIVTGTPGDIDENFTYIEVIKKGERPYSDILDRFWRVHDTGLTRILGGRGVIEAKLGQVFRHNLLPQIQQWENYGEVDSSRTERALLRHTLNHLIQLIDEELELSFPEEFYLYPPVTDGIRTGSIVQEHCSDNRFVVMSPDCDLVVRDNGSRNTDKILVVEIVPPTVLFPWFDAASLSDLSNNRKGALRNALKNNSANYHHCLPETKFTSLGFMDFRSLYTLTEEEFEEQFRTPHELQISPPFVKDIVARFSSYYARQGQPDIDFEDFIGS